MMSNTSAIYPEVEANPDFPKIEERVLAYWKQEGIFEASVEARASVAGGKSNEFIFYDGPPFANGLPHYGHLLTSFVKDVFARYQTMRGHRVERRFGWDCHGLPAEMGAEKELGISGRQAITQYGIAQFNDYCRTSVMKYTREWEYYVSRAARWVDFEHDYKTMDTPYMESVLWAFKQLYDKGWVYEAYRVMPYSWAAETPLSNFETRLDNSYREREDRAITVAFELNERPKGAPDAEKYYILAWTTTPWTLPSNLALAVNTEIEYVGFRCVADVFHLGLSTAAYYIASASAAKHLGKVFGYPTDEVDVDFSIHGVSLLNLTYKPLFPYFKDHPNSFRILDGSDFVTDTDGTGIVHMAPGFGEDDQRCCEANGIELVCPVDGSGRFTDEIYDIDCSTSLTPTQPSPSGVEGLDRATGEAENPLPLREGAGGGVKAKRGYAEQTLENARELRTQRTDAEIKLWQALRGKQIERFKFRQQQPIGPYIADFFCAEAKLIIEVDGSQHAEQAAYDAERTTFFEKAGYRVLRFWNNEVLQQTEGVLQRIFDTLSASLPPTQPSPSGGEGFRQVLSLKGKNVLEENLDKYKFGEANELIIKWLKEHGQLIGPPGQIKHNYPHCWRTDKPLIYRAVPSWYVAVTKFRDRMVELNQQINWIPEHVKDGLFGKWLENARDWSISRNRFWGTPIPVWKSKSGKIKVFGSIAELEKASGQKVTDLHRPQIDDIVILEGGEEYRRVEDVFDCWFESGSMPYAQVHYPFENKAWFEKHFPADFITEYVAQTRGWFYTLMVLSTALFDKPPFKNCICHGVVIDDETGLKYSKRLKNYKDPKWVFDTFGADALRWLMLSSPVMRGLDLSVDPEGKFIRDVVRLAIKPIWNAYNFFCLYANADGAKAEWRSDSENLMDRYILAKCKLSVERIAAALDAYDTPSACESVSRFFEALNNWYIRRSKERFWKESHDADKQAAYDTLYTVLVTMCKAAAPLLPLTLDEIYKGLTGSSSIGLPRTHSPLEGESQSAKRDAVGGGDVTVTPPASTLRASRLVSAALPQGEGNSSPTDRWPAHPEKKSVHLADYPDVSSIPTPEKHGFMDIMEITRDACNAALAIRNKNNIRVRQPLASIRIVGKAAATFGFNQHLVPEITKIIQDEINVKEVVGQQSQQVEDFAIFKLHINFPVLGKRLPERIKQIIPAAKKGQWKQLPEGWLEVAGETLEPNEFTLLLEPKPEFKNRAQPLSTNDALVILDTDITPELEAEGYARDLVRLIQQARKDSGLHVSDRIHLRLRVSEKLAAAVERHQGFIAEQVLASTLSLGDMRGAAFIVNETIENEEVSIGFSVNAEAA